MISFSKTANHYGEEDTESVNIYSEGKTLGDVTKAFHKFLNACGFQHVEEEAEVNHHQTKRSREDFFI